LSYSPVLQVHYTSREGLLTSPCTGSSDYCVNHQQNWDTFWDRSWWTLRACSTPSKGNGLHSTFIWTSTRNCQYRSQYVILGTDATLRLRLELLMRLANQIRRGAVWT